MLILSVFCLLRAAIPALPMDVVSEGKIYKTKPPIQIAGFGKSSSEAGQYAGILNQYNGNSPPTMFLTGEEIMAPYRQGKISQAKFTGQGWIVHHQDETGQNFVSYVVSTVTSWNTLKTTIDTTLEYFMRGYTAAFLTPASNPAASVADAKTVMKELEETCKKSAQEILGALPNMLSYQPNFPQDEEGMEQAIRCHASLKKIYAKLEKEVSDPVKTLKGKILNSDLGEKLQEELRNIWGAILSKKAEDEQCYAFDARDDTFFHKICLENPANQVLEYLKSKTMFFTYKNNGAWDGNNCIFESIGYTTGALEELVKFLELTLPNVQKTNGQTWSSYWPKGGKILRETLFNIFEKDEDLSFIAEMCRKEDSKMEKVIIQLRGKAKDLTETVKEFRTQIVSKYKQKTEWLPVWLHEYISRKTGLIIYCLVPNTINNKVLTSHFEREFNCNHVTDKMVFVVNVGRYHYDGLRYVRTGW